MSPEAVGARTWATVALGGAHTCMVDAAGDVYCHGLNGAGQLGLAEPGTYAKSARVDGVSSVRAVAAGTYFTCAAHRDGAVACWGELGTPPRTPHATLRTPRPAQGVEQARALSAGRAHVCALSQTGHVWCWGSNRSGQLGVPKSGPKAISGETATPQPVPALPAVVSVAAGGAHTCAVSRGGQVYCWGRNHHGQLGRKARAAPEPVGPVVLPKLAPHGQLVEVCAGQFHSCGRNADGRVVCWGRNLAGQVDGQPGPDVHAPRPVALARPVHQIACGSAHTCGLLDSGDVACWGEGFSGALSGAISGVIVADGDAQLSMGIRVLEGAARVEQIAAGHARTCLLRREAEAGEAPVCFGRD